MRKNRKVEVSEKSITEPLFFAEEKLEEG